MNRRDLLKILAVAPLLPSVIQGEPMQTLVIDSCGHIFEADVPVRDEYEVDWFAYAELKETGEVVQSDVVLQSLGKFPMRKVQ